MPVIAVKLLYIARHRNLQNIDMTCDAHTLLITLNKMALCRCHAEAEKSNASCNVREYTTEIIACTFVH